MWRTGQRRTAPAEPEHRSCHRRHQLSPAIKDAFGWSQEFEGREPDQLSADDLAAVLMVNAVEQLCGSVLYRRDPAELEREAKRRLAIAAAYGIDPLTGQAVQTSARQARKAKVKKAVTPRSAEELEEETPERAERTGDLFQQEAVA